MPQPSVPGSPTEDRIACLDGLRALCFMQVLVGHAGWSALVGGGGLGVTIFFALSGFVITHLLLREFARTGSVAFGRFLGRRALRLWPALFLYLTITWITSPWTAPVGYGPLDTLTIVSLYAHFANYVSVFHEGAQAPPGAGVCWSLAVEEHFYLAYPLILSALLVGRSLRIFVAGLLALCLAALAWRAVVWGHSGDWHRIYLSTDTRFDGLLYGCIAAATRTWWVGWLRPGARPYLAVALALGLILLSAQIREPWFRETARYSIQAIAATIVVMALGVLGDSLAGRVLNHPVLVYLGRISYELYLVHLTVLVGLGTMLDLHAPATLIPVGLGLSLVFATALHYTATVPALKLRDRLLP